MKKIAYLTNSFPEQCEFYVWEEIGKLRAHGRTVISCSFRRPKKIPPDLAHFAAQTQYVLRFEEKVALQSFVLLLRIHLIRDLVWRAIRGPEAFARKLRTLGHTVLGIYLAANLRNQQISHIHVHHGYFAAWSGMVAARLLGATFSMTLHGSDLLMRNDYLDSKLQNCKFCVTVSEFNRDYIHQHYPSIHERKVFVHRLGVDLDFWRPAAKTHNNTVFAILSVGRLHSVKNHEFLLCACNELQKSGVRFNCVIVGGGPERERLQRLVHQFGLQAQVELHGHVPREVLPDLYRQADVIVLTSRSEGIPVAAMEAMAMERIVLAPEITGIPELISNGQTGFLYQPHSMRDFLAKLTHISAKQAELNDLRRAARRHIERNFNRELNLQRFTVDFLRQIDTPPAQEQSLHANPVLQQI